MESEKKLDPKTEAAVAKLRYLADKLVSGEWRLVRDATTLRPGRPERYVIEYEIEYETSRR